MTYYPNNPNGQATMANSSPVVVASDQSAVPVSGTVTANIGTVATLATAAKQDTGNTSLATVAGAVSGTEMQVDVVAALPAGTNNIGDVDVLSVIPGTGATNLGKAVDSVAGATDTGVVMLAKHVDEDLAITSAEGDYDVLRLDARGALHSSPEQHISFDSFDATTGWSALSNDTLNLATTTKHIQGTAALTFDKVNGAANTVFAGIQKTITSINLGDVAAHDLLQGAFYIPDITNVSYVFLRLGTDSSNYNEWRIPDTNITQATFLTASQNIGDANYAGITGNGWNSAAITYIAVGVAFDAETNTLAGIIFDEVSFHTNLHTAASSSLEINSSVTTPNVNLQRVGGTATATNSGNLSNGTLRVAIATDDVNMAAIKTAVEILDNAISGSEMQVDVVTSALPSGASTAAKQPALGTAGTASADVITVQGIASMTALKVDGSGVTQPVSGTVTVTATNLDVQSGGADLATSAQAGAIQTAVELIDDTVKVLGTDTYTEAATKGLVIGAVRRDADTTLVDTTNEIGPVQMNAAGQLKVEVFSGETLPVSLTSTTVTGTVAVTQSGTWDEVGINDSGNSITVDAPVGTPAFVRLSDGAAAISTLPVSLASVPSHAVTNAGTFAVQVDGNALTALQLIDDGVATVASAITTKGMAAVGTDGTNARILKTDTSGELQVDVLTMPTVTVNAHAVTNAGTFAVQVDGNALTALQKIDDPVLVDDAAFTPATSSVTMAGFQADETATDSVDEGDAGAARMTLDRKVIVTVQPHTAGGWSVANCTTGDTFTALTNSAQVIKASAGSFGGYYYYNPNATASYINVYDVAAASVTVGTTTPKLTYCIPPTAAANIEIVHGIPFGTAMSASATTTGGGNTAPSTALEVMFWYK